MAVNSFIFQDKASLILRAMHANPERKWVTRDFVKEAQISIGLASKALAELRNRGFLKGDKRGRLAGGVLRERDELVKQWTHFYSIEKNTVQALYSEDKEILRRIRDHLSEKGVQFAFTLHTGANLITGHVRDPNIYFYLDSKGFNDTLFEMRQALNLKELKQGGNIFIFNPYYKRSIFFGRQTIAEHAVVSNLQLYLDLFHFPQRGQEQIEALEKILKKKEHSLAQ